MKFAVALVAIAALAAGGTARIVLAGHWTSRLHASTALGLALAMTALALDVRLLVSGRR